MPADNIIQGLWIGDRLSKMEQLSICSFLANGHEYHLYLYKPLANLPSGVVIKNAADILTADKIFKYKERDTFAGFADYFRYKLLMDRGGWWCDLDVVCLRPFAFSSEYIFGQESQPDGSAGLSSCVIRAPADSAVMQYAWDRCCSKDPREIRWGEVGPALLREAAREFLPSDGAMGVNAFCPVAYFKWFEVLNPDYIINLENTYAVHLWHEMWRRSKIDTDNNFNPGCLYERLKRIYKIT